MGAEFLAPTSVRAALEGLAAPDSLAVSGGTAVALLLKNRLARPSRLVWLGRVEELRGIEGVRVGALTTLAELASSPAVRDVHPVVAEAAGGIGNVRVRAVATVGGHLANADPRQDLPPVLVALGATVLTSGQAGERRIPAEAFFAGHFETALLPGELVTGVELPPADPRRRSVYLRFKPGSQEDYPTVAVAGSRSAAGVRIAVGGVAERPLLVAGPEGVEAAEPVSDQRGSAAYKKAMARVFVERALEALG